MPSHFIYYVNAITISNFDIFSFENYYYFILYTNLHILSFNINIHIEVPYNGRA